MKQIFSLLVLMFISNSICERANNVENRDNDSCPDFPDTSGTIESVSDCVDFDLYNGERYYTKCCFARIMIGWNLLQGMCWINNGRNK